jgi:hypothetical protein
MDENESKKLSRRDFAHRAILLSATASLAPAAIALEPSAQDNPPAKKQEQPNLPKLPPASQAEADTRFQFITTLPANQFDDEQKAVLKTLCVFLQPALDRVRAYHLENSDGPALYLKPLVEREKKPQPIHTESSKKS